MASCEVFADTKVCSNWSGNDDAQFRCLFERVFFRVVDGKTGKSVNELATEVQLKLGTSLRQRIWTGCPCNTIHNDTALASAKDASINFAHWSKGPLTWTSSFSNQMNSEALLKYETPFN